MALLVSAGLLLAVAALVVLAFRVHGPVRGLIPGIVVLLIFLARAFYRTRAEKVRQRLLTMSEEEAGRVGHYSARCPRCGREKLRDAETDEKIHPEEAFEYAGRPVFCTRCSFEGPLEPES